MTDRPTAQDLVDAFAATGLVPTRGVYCEVRDGKRCGCGVGAWCLMKDPGMDAKAVCFGRSELPMDYGTGIIAGFDGRPVPECCGRVSAFMQGHAAGKEAARMLGLEELGT